MCDRLIELLRQRSCYYVDCKGRNCAGCQNVFIQDNDIESIADHLLANGVIVPPCKVGDTVYYINLYNHIMLYRDRVYEAAVSRIVVTKYGVSAVIRVHGGHAVNEIPNVEFGKTVFLTREEAEQALKGEHHG